MERRRTAMTASEYIDSFIVQWGSPIDVDTAPLPDPGTADLAHLGRIKDETGVIYAWVPTVEKWHRLDVPCTNVACTSELNRLRERNEKLEKVAMRARDVRIFALTMPDDLDGGDADELLDQALAELEQPCRHPNGA
jgi:hypothetical protein